MYNSVVNIAAADATAAVEHFSARLAFEADCWDTHEALHKREPGFVVLDVRSHELYRRRHIPGAISLPQGKIVTSKLVPWSQDTVFVVYCAGPHCNGANKAALKLAKLGRPVKELIGGMTGWADEGFAFFSGDEPGSVHDVE